MVGDTVRRITDADPSLCTVVTNDTNGSVMVEQLDLPDCPASAEIANTMAFVTGLIMVCVLIMTRCELLLCVN